MELNRDTEIRDVPVTVYQLLARFFEGDESILSLLMGNIRVDNDDPNSTLRFTSEDVEAIRNHAEVLRRPPVVVLIDEWSTMGKSRPKLGHFLDILIKCELFRAAEFLAEKIQEPQPARPLQGPAARVEIMLPAEVDSLVNGLDYPFSTLQANQDLAVKPSINKPNMGFSEQSRVDNASVPFIKPPNMTTSTSLIKFSRNTPLEQATSEAFLPDMDALQNSNPIPATTNSEGALSYDNIPAFSGLIQSGDSQHHDEYLPIMLLRSLEINQGARKDAGASGPSKIFNGESSSQISDQTTHNQSSSSLSSSSS